MAFWFVRCSVKPVFGLQPHHDQEAYKKAPQPMRDCCSLPTICAEFCVSLEKEKHRRLLFIINLKTTSFGGGNEFSGLA